MSFLRRVEHRIQYLDDQQTHVLPTRDDDLAWIAQHHGLPDCCAFLRELDAHRELVAQEFDTCWAGGKKQCNGGGCGNAAGGAAAPDWRPCWTTLPAAFASAWPSGATTRACTALRDEARARLFRLVQRTAQWLREGQVSEEAAVRLADWLEPLLRRESYLALLLERPAVHEQLLHLLGAPLAGALPAAAPRRDRRAGRRRAAAERFVAADFERDLELRRKARCRSTGEDDDETLLNLLRRAHHAETFRTLARDVEGRITVEQVADDLSALADSVLRVTTLVLAAPEKPPPRRAAVRHHWLRQAGRQRAGLRQRPGHRLRLSTTTTNAPPRSTPPLCAS
jgi:glutamate-ammonia-ligase adenylyltransferase